MKSFYRASLIALGADQASKIIIRKLLPEGAGVDSLSPWVAIIHCRNTGAAFGLLQGMAWLLIPFTILAVAAVVYMAFHYRHLALPLGFIAGGSLGNIVDRISRGFVTDFISLPCWPVFNLADLFITAGAAFLALMLMKSPETIENGCSGKKKRKGESRNSE